MGVYKSSKICETSARKTYWKSIVKAAGSSADSLCCCGTQPQGHSTCIPSCFAGFPVCLETADCSWGPKSELSGWLAGCPKGPCPLPTLPFLSPPLSQLPGFQTGNPEHFCCLFKPVNFYSSSPQWIPTPLTPANGSSSTKGQESLVGVGCWWVRCC